MLKHNKVSTSFVFSDNFVTEKFHANGTYNEGSILFQPLYASNMTSLQVTLMDKTGNIQKNDVYDLSFIGDNLIPNAAAYNSITEEYIVTGVCLLANNGNKYGSWFLLFDNQLNLKVSKIFDLVTLNPHAVPQSFGANTSTFVTDVCPAYDQTFISTGIHFAFTGLLLEDGNNPHPRVNFLNQPVRRTLFIALLNTSSYNIAFAHDYFFEYNTSDATKYTFPSRIVEVKQYNNNNLAGFIVGGTTANHFNDDAKRFFYLRVRGDLTVLDHKVIDDGWAGGSDYIYAVNDLHFQEVNGIQEVLVAGTITNNQNPPGLHGLFFDKIYGTANVQSWLDQWPNPGGTQQMGVIWLNYQRLNSYPKIGRITPLNNSNTNVITGSLCRNTFYQNPVTFLHTHLLPFVIEVDYSNNSLNNWITNQSGLFDLYPRNNGHLGVLNYYNSMDFSSPWYPNHKSHVQTTTLTSRDYMLGSLVNEDLTSPLTDYVVQNLVRRPYQNNNCMHDEDLGDIQMLWTDIQQFLIYEEDMDAKTYDLDIYMPTFDMPNVVDCAQQPDPFKPINIETNTKYNYHCTNDILYFDGWSKKYTIEIVDINNKLIYKLQNVDYLQYNLSHLSRGIYLLKIKSTTDAHTDIIKLAK